MDLGGESVGKSQLCHALAHELFSSSIDAQVTLHEKRNES